jgi:hypothetical protein
VNWWRNRRRAFWFGVAQFAALLALGFGAVGLADGAPVLIALAVCFTVLTFTFGRRSRP